MTTSLRRVAFLRSIEIQQAAPVLEPLRDRFAELAVEARLIYTDGDVGLGHWPGTAQQIPVSADVADVVARLTEMPIATVDVGEMEAAGVS